MTAHQPFPPPPADAAAEPLPPDHLFRPGETCWRVATAEQAAVLVDMATYYRAVRTALAAARHSVLLLGWSFDPRTALEPDPDEPDQSVTIGDALNRLQARRPDIDIRLLVWDMSLPMAAAQGFFPHRSPSFLDRRIKFRLDATVPFGACHHQKVLVIDDSIAFCGGGDFVPDRWDTTCHRDTSRRRRLPSGSRYPPRHDVMVMVSGPLAAALGDFARYRWQCATGEALPASRGGTPWPRAPLVDMIDVPAAVARTVPAGEAAPAACEVEAQYLELIREAKRYIYLENQYFTSRVIGEALAARLAEPDGPEVVVLCGRSAGAIDRVTMDSARAALVAELARRDAYGRFRCFRPLTAGGRPILLHSKVAVVDDRWLRIGSANLNNRSMGFDTELDITFDAALSADAKRAERAVRGELCHLVSHFLGCERDAFASAWAEAGGLGRAIDALNTEGRLRPVSTAGPGPLGAFVASRALGDPLARADAWRPWKRSPGPVRPPWRAAVALGAVAALIGWRIARR